MNPDPKIPGPVYRIETERLVIRCFNPADALLLHEAITVSVLHLARWLSWTTQEPQTVQQRIERLRVFRHQFDSGEDFVYGIFNRDETAVLGGCGLHTRIGPNNREIGYWIHRDQINRGLATEMVRALTQVAFTVDQVRRVEIHVAVGNEASSAVARKAGYRYEATLPRRVQDGQLNWHDIKIWTMFAEDYPNCAASEIPIQMYDAAGRRIES